MRYVIAIVLALSACEASPAYADELLDAAQICYAEAGTSKSDCAAILHVAKKRAHGGSWSNMLRRYASLHKVHTPRSRWIKRLPWAYAIKASARFNAQWADLCHLVYAWSRGYVADPCPRAVHWGSVTDVPSERLRRVRCTEHTRNLFYRVTA